MSKLQMLGLEKPLSVLIGKTLVGISYETENGELRMVAINNEMFQIYSTCPNTYIPLAGVIGDLNDLIGYPILSVSAQYVGDDFENTVYSLSTERGDVCLLYPASAGLSFEQVFSDPH